MFQRLRQLSLTMPPKAEIDRRTALYVLLLLGIAWRITQGLEQHMDILFWDEANYLNRGLWMFDRIPKVWGPTYSAWYKLLSIFESDKVALYYLNYRVMTAGTVLAAFFFLSVCGVRQWIAFLLSASLLFSAYNLPVWPKISHYCILLVMGAAIAGSFTRDILARSCLFSLGLLIAAYARPELFLAFGVSLLMTLVIGIVRLRRSMRAVQVLFAFTLLWSAAVCWYYKTPFNSGDSGRGIKVFYQHYSLNYIREHQLDLNWWLDWETIVAKNFKHPESLQGILQYDAAAFFYHLWSNVLTFAGSLASLAGQLLLPWKTNSIVPPLFGLACLALYLLPFRFSGWRERLCNGMGRNLFTLACLFIFVAPGILVCIYAYPRAHYLVIYVPLILLLAGLLLDSLHPEAGGIRPNLALLAGVALLLFAPKAHRFEFYQLERKEASLANAKTVAFLQPWGAADTIRVFDLEGDISTMLKGPFTGYTNAYLQQRPANALKFIDDNQIGVIYVTPPMLQYEPLQRDTAFQRLLTNPEELHFYRVKTGTFAPYLLIRKTP